jgi:hypothetical protein
MIDDYRKLAMFMLSVCLLGLTSCASMVQGPKPAAPPPSGYSPQAAERTGFWWACRFKVFWPPDEDPDLTVDLLLAHSVVRPVLRKYESKLIYWRFHRRAAHDKTGHQFSLLFYSDPHTAAEIFGELRSSKPLNDAMEAKIVESITTDDPASPVRPRVEDYSDPSWSPTLQRNWPSFIMGVSALWLGLIDEAMAEAPPCGADIRASLGRYREADAKVSAIWNKEGQHAFLHHLSAVFGYKPMLIRKEITF